MSIEGGFGGLLRLLLDVGKRVECWECFSMLQQVAAVGPVPAYSVKETGESAIPPILREA